MRIRNMSPFVKIIAICFVVGSTYAAAPHCCMSKKFFGKGLIITATLAPGSTAPTMSQNSFNVESNYDTKLQAVNGTTIVENQYGEIVTNYQVIRDFNHMKSYNFNDTHCHIDQIVGEEMPDGCVPKTLAAFGPYTMGSGNESMQINGWAGRIGNKTQTIATTVNDCTFVSYTILGTQPDGTKVTETGQFVDMVQYRNSYDAVFDIPQHCNAGAQTVGK